MDLELCALFKSEKVAVGNDKQTWLADHKRSMVVTEVQRLVQAGASVTRSKAFHVAVAGCSQSHSLVRVAGAGFRGFCDLAYLKLLVDIDPACLNSRDRKFVTPLMVAAEFSAGSGFVADVLRKLVDLGADKSVQDDKGLTAYGRFCAVVQRNQDYAITFGLGTIVPVGETRHSMIMHEMRKSDAGFGRRTNNCV